jgi:hypothetical protein
MCEEKEEKLARLGCSPSRLAKNKGNVGSYL